MKNIILAVMVFLLLYMAFVNSGPDAVVSSASSVDCVTAIEQRYSPVWADMNRVQRFAIGMRAATCEGGK